MILENIDCRYLKVTIPSLETVYGLDELSELEIQGTFNDDDTVTETIDLSALTGEWQVEVTYSASTTITQVYLRNIFTNQTFALLASTYTVTEPNVILLIAELEAALADLGITGVTIDYEFSGADLLILTFSGMPEKIIPDSIAFTTSGVADAEYFSNVDSDKYIITNDKIYLTPAFFGLSEFDDAIIHLKATITTINDDQMWEENCFFMDCNMRGYLTENIDPTNCVEADVHLIMLHYALTQASNYECDCDRMYDIFEFLDNNIITTQREPCGC